MSFRPVRRCGELVSLLVTVALLVVPSDATATVAKRRPAPLPAPDAAVVPVGVGAATTAVDVTWPAEHRWRGRPLRYKVVRADGGVEGPRRTVCTVGPAVRACRDQVAVDGVAHFYAVKAVNGRHRSSRLRHWAGPVSASKPPLPPTAVTVAAVRPDQTLDVSVTLPASFGTGTFHHLHWSADDSGGSQGDWVPAAAPSPGASLPVLLTGPLVIDNRPVVVSVALCTTTAAATPVCSAPTSSSTPGLAAQPYALPLVPAAAPSPCSVDPAGVVTFAWSAPAANGRPVNRYLVNGGGFPTDTVVVAQPTGVESVTRSYPGDGGTSTIAVSTVDSVGARSVVSRQITCPHAVPTTVVASGNGTMPAGGFIDWETGAQSTGSACAGCDAGYAGGWGSPTGGTVAAILGAAGANPIGTTYNGLSCTDLKSLPYTANLQTAGDAGSTTVLAYRTAVGHYTKVQLHFDSTASISYTFTTYAC
ncbi:hypothetical protein ACFFOS_15770 [Nocardioides kongjuensis]|uniref:Fibronectin type-III domain-containing protein n=1 Tax=Nocardioides kongjuensis TaxID=349522 RepID=A0A852RWT1_9ACTN|nr:hypothetical protein [Nocardioides kongjuensis]NYD32314.1 hypothetical protein [Nocardioides kongjuensis]